MKNIIKKISKFIISRALYFALGICVAVAVSVVYAAVVTWPAPQVTSGNTLTAELWNTFAENLDDLDSRVNDFQKGVNVYLCPRYDYFFQGAGCNICCNNCKGQLGTSNVCKNRNCINIGCSFVGKLVAP